MSRVHIVEVCKVSVSFFVKIDCTCNGGVLGDCYIAVQADHVSRYHITSF